ncbi:MAG: hypothetical protein WC349_03775 [Patescibacteria group bacterium]|jgi:hypothetical protein
MTKKYLFLLILPLALVAVVSGCQSKVTNGNKEIKTPPEGIISSSTVENLPVWPEQKYAEKDYEGWKTYFNKELGYSIKYPPIWTVSPCNREDPSTWAVNACDMSCGTKEIVISPLNTERSASYINISVDCRNKNIELIRRELTDANFSIRRNMPDYKPYIENKIIFSGKKSFLFINQMIENNSDVYFDYKDASYKVGTSKNNDPLVLQSIASFKFIE